MSTFAALVFYNPLSVSATSTFRPARYHAPSKKKRKQTKLNIAFEDVSIRKRKTSYTSPMAKSKVCSRKPNQAPILLVRYKQRSPQQTRTCEPTLEKKRRRRDPSTCTTPKVP
ncbi:hypothetical protein IWZ00DRAFT_305026 [Phyllosticta capitalensis]